MSMGRFIPLALTTLIVTSAWGQIAADHMAERIALVNDLRVARVDRKIAYSASAGTTTNAAAMIMRMSERKQWYLKEGMTMEPQRGHVFRLVTIHVDDAVTISDQQDNVFTLQLITQAEKEEYRIVHDMPKHDPASPKLRRAGE